MDRIIIMHSHQEASKRMPINDVAHRSQISNRTEDGLIGSTQSFLLQSPVGFVAYVTASLPKPHVILTVGHRVLYGCVSEARLGRVEGDVPKS
jgi:hypothetical protein